MVTSDRHCVTDIETIRYFAPQDFDAEILYPRVNVSKSVSIFVFRGTGFIYLVLLTRVRRFLYESYRKLYAVGFHIFPLPPPRTDCDQPLKSLRTIFLVSETRSKLRECVWAWPRTPRPCRSFGESSGGDEPLAHAPSRRETKTPLQTTRL